jgi:hypothetical protein
MYWHASEFYLGEGDDPARALELLRKNAELRPNATSFVALARAELAAGTLDGARASIERALAAPVVSAELFWTAARVRARMHDRAESARLAARARALNPRIALTEPDDL